MTFSLFYYIISKNDNEKGIYFNMKEALYTIPVNDAFDNATESPLCECPICSMYNSIQSDAINFTLGPSYMEDDIRMVTDKSGFCKDHLLLLYKHQNRLGLGLMLHTHMQHTVKNAEKLAKSPVKAPSFFKKDSQSNKLIDFIENINNSCYICNRVNTTFDRYIATIFHLYKTDSSFAEKIKKSNGFCNEHFVCLYKNASTYLSGRDYEEFISLITSSYIDNMKRVTDDVEWFTDKFDYRNTDAPWKNSKDALQRAVLKTTCGKIDA